MSERIKLVDKALPKEINDKISGAIKDEFGIFLQENKEKLSPVIFGELTGSSGKLMVGKGFTDNLIEQVITYDEIEKMRHDCQISIGLAIKKLPIMGLNYDFFSSDEGARQFFKEQFEKVGRKVIQSSLLSLDYGFVPHEIVYDRQNVTVVNKGTPEGKVLFKRDNAIVWKKIKPIFPADVNLELDNKNNFVAFQQYGYLNSNRGADVTRVPAEKSLLVTYQEEFGNVYGRTCLIPSYTPWYMKYLLTQFMMRFFEKRGTPPTVIKAPPGKTVNQNGLEVDNLEEARKLGESMLENSVVVLPMQFDKKSGSEMWSVAYLDDKGGGGRTDQFLEAIQHFDTQILRGLLIPERAITQDAGTGTFSMSQTHADFFLLEEEGMLKKIEDDFNSQLIPPMVKANFVKEIDILFKFDTLQFGKKELLKDIYLQVLKGQGDFMKNFGSVPYKVTPDVEKLAKELDLPTKPVELVQVANIAPDNPSMQNAIAGMMTKNPDLKNLIQSFLVAGKATKKEDINRARKAVGGKPDDQGNIEDKKKFSITVRTPNISTQKIIDDKKKKKKKPYINSNFKVSDALDDRSIDAMISFLQSCKSKKKKKKKKNKLAMKY